MPRSSDWSLPFRLSNQNLACIFPRPLCMPWILPPHLLDLIISVIRGEGYKVYNSLCECLQPLVTYSLLGPNVLPSSMFSRTSSNCVLPPVRVTKFHKNTNSQREKL
jgi:hypothetical protein